MIGVSPPVTVCAERKVVYAHRNRGTGVVTAANKQLITLLHRTKRIRGLRSQPHYGHGAMVAHVAAANTWQRVLWHNPGRARRAMSMAARLLRSHPERVGVPVTLAEETAAVLEAELNEPWEHWVPLAPEPVQLATHVILRWRRVRRSNWSVA